MPEVIPVGNVPVELNVIAAPVTGLVATVTIDGLATEMLLAVCDHLRKPSFEQLSYHQTLVSLLQSMNL